MARYTVAVLIVVALAAGVWWLWPETDPTATPTTLPLAVPSTTASDNTSSAPPTSVTESQVVETVEEAEAILRNLWFGWFEGIYNEDEDRIREVVATEEQVATAQEQFGVMEFVTAPTPEGLTFSEVEILRSDEECLAVWAVTDATAIIGDGATQSAVEVIRQRDDSWVLLSSWPLRGDLWENDCEALLSPSQ